jgi:hypothetical protein
MTYTAPTTRTTGTLITAAIWNTDVVDNITYLKSSIAAQFFLSGAGGWPSTTSGCAQPAQAESATYKVNDKTLDFDKDTLECAEWNHALPSDYGGGTVTATFYWKANDATNNAVVWGLQARAYGDGDVTDAAYGTAQDVTDANASTAYQTRISAATAAITIAGTPAAGKLVQWRVYRKGAEGSDTLAVDAKLLGVMITYTRS